MGMDRAAAAARVGPAETPGGEAGLTLAALIDVLDRADEVPVRSRPRPRRAALHRPHGRTVADRWDPLRDLDVRPGTTARRPGSASRALVGGAGTNRPVPRVVTARAVPLRSVPPAPPARPPVVSAPAPAAPVRGAVAPVPSARTTPPLAARLRAALASVARRAAQWGAGPGGAHLAWNAPAPARVHRAGPPAVTPPRRVDPPVQLRELPSTPTASAPPRAPRPAPTTPVRPRPPARTAPVRPLRVPALSTVRRIPPLPPAHGSVPNRARSPGGARGSPGSGPARGSPPWWPEPGRAPEARRSPARAPGR